ncbi:NACHT domain-containing protein [Ideonella sp. A 288]|uniref:NACHT domain-containing protein n=1 Tax=Ideonella sp. A 288 TaxID=1962181 RepID=UPI0013034638|nr:NACHT domain-containing protein [Ideonella sp. A 288]
MGLLFSVDDLVGITVEGFSTEDRGKVSKEANEIADAVLYYGEAASFVEARSVVVVQVKYSKAAELLPFRASDAKKTLGKFARTYLEHKRKHGAAKTREKLHLQLVTNRTVLPELIEAVRGLAAGTTLRGTARVQANQVRAACKLNAGDLREFAGRLQLIGLTGNLREAKHQLAIALADWSPACDAMARVRLNDVRELAREKAGLASQDRNVISRTDVLTALGIQDENDLLPCPASFPMVGEVVPRHQLAEVVARVPTLTQPLLVHADGGVGKTVFVNSVAAGLAEEHEVVLFDCFGMGQYRAPGDARHLPKRGLVHIVNDLACRGLCDPLLPTSSNSDDIIRTFRVRLKQAAQTISRSQSNRLLILFLDAIDNASDQARDRDEDAFPRLLLESVTVSGQIPGVRIVVSARTHRRTRAAGEASYDEIELRPFTPAETEQFLATRVSELTDVGVQVAQSRSGGNARVLEHLAAKGAERLAESETDKPILLDDLIRERIANALAVAKTQGYRDQDVGTFLASLATLPPPVPVSDLAAANQLAIGAVESFAADLAPLLERTKHGLMFRDEPTETLIRETYSTDTTALGVLAKSLYGMQGTSVYAAATLPVLLQQLDDGEQLYRLAFEERFPVAAASTVGQRAIRIARIKAAITHSAGRDDPDRLVPLLVEMSTLAATDQRGTQYLLDHPDLTVASGDVESLRRLFEVRTKWPGTKHARLAIAHALSGDIADAYRHALRVEEWRSHYFEQDEDYRRDNGSPTALDMASIPFCRLANGDVPGAARDISGWRYDSFVFEVAEHVFALARWCAIDQEALTKFMLERQIPGVLIAALSAGTVSEGLQRTLIKSLALALKKRPEGLSLGVDEFRAHARPIVRGLLHSACLAVIGGMDEDAQTILAALEIPTPSLFTFMDSHWTRDVYPFVAKQVLTRLASGRPIAERDLLPEDLESIARVLPPGLAGTDLRKALKAEHERIEREKVATDRSSSTSNARTSVERFLDSRLDGWLQVAQAFSCAFRGGQGRSKASLTPLLDAWTTLRKKRDYYGGVEAQQQHNAVGERLLSMALGANSKLYATEVQRYVDALSGDGVVNVSSLIEVTGTLSRRPAFHVIAGKLATRVKAKIECEDDVDQRAADLAELARAIAPASGKESIEYFRLGLNQMDAIGSGDYQFVNELMHFASSLHGERLSDVDSHTLSNICELNLGEERKFNWGVYGAAMVKAAGPRGLAKLARWEDRERVSLDYSLLSYLHALLDDGQIDPSLALTMLRICNPTELFVCNTAHLVASLEKWNDPRLKEWAKTLCEQWLRDNPGLFMSSTLGALVRLAKRALGEASIEWKYLSEAAARNDSTIDTYNALNNWRPGASAVHVKKQEAEKAAAQKAVRRLAAETDPLDEMAVVKAVATLEAQRTGGRLEWDLLALLRARVSYADWPVYIHLVARQPTFDIYTKMRELSACKEAWCEASNAVATALRESAEIVVRENASDFISYEYLSSSHLKELSDISGVNREMLVKSLTREFSRPDASIPASVWLGIAAEFNAKAKPGVGQRALARLLSTGPEKLASSVADGAYQSDLCPPSDPVAVTAGLIWFALGAPKASRRWMAAHSLRTAVRLGRTDVLDQVVNQAHWTSAGAFQARELRFFHLHAQLWLLVALARLAIDAPRAVAKHHKLLLSLATDSKNRHVLQRNFAAQALLACLRGGTVTLDSATLKQVQQVNSSRRHLKTISGNARSAAYLARPKTFPAPTSELHLEYEFDKHEVASLSELFDRPHWETAEAIGTWVRQYDKEITQMSDSDGRSGVRQERTYGISPEHHSYGEHLCWHGLHGVAGDLLAAYPVVRHSYDCSDPWAYWLDQRLLTHSQGLWLADGTEIRPLDTRTNLREAGKSGVQLTGNRDKLLSLLGISSSVGDWLVADGSWNSLDGVDVLVQTALVPSRKSAAQAKVLASMDPFQAYLPRLEGDEDEDFDSFHRETQAHPWVVISKHDGRLDAADVLGVTAAARRARLSVDVNASFRLTPRDPFRREWSDPTGQVLVRSEVWATSTDRNSGSRDCGTRLLVHRKTIQGLLEARASDLLLLLILRRYEARSGADDSKYWHTTAVARVTQALEFEFYPGRINALHKSRY